MAGYGFRLYTVKLVTGYNKSKAVEFDKCGPTKNEHVGVWLRKVFTSLEAYPPLVGPPVQFRVADEDAPPPIEGHVRVPSRGELCTHFVSHSATPQTRIEFTLEYARVGDVDLGMNLDGSFPLSHVPTGHTHRGILYLPPTGTKGILALEAVPGGAHPQRMLNAWLTRAALDVAAESASGMSPEQLEKQRPLPYKLNFNQYPNLERIARAVESNPAAKVVLRRDTIDGAGMEGDELITISSTLHSQERRNAAAKMAQNLVRKLTKQLHDDEEPVGVEDLEQLIDGSLEGIEWTEGYIQIDDPTGTKRIGLDQIDKYFIYPFGGRARPSDAAFLEGVASEVVGLQTKLGLDLDL